MRGLATLGNRDLERVIGLCICDESADARYQNKHYHKLDEVDAPTEKARSLELRQHNHSELCTLKTPRSQVISETCLNSFRAHLDCTYDYQDNAKHCADAIKEVHRKVEFADHVGRE